MKSIFNVLKFVQSHMVPGAFPEQKPDSALDINLRVAARNQR